MILIPVVVHSKIIGWIQPVWLLSAISLAVFIQVLQLNPKFDHRRCHFPGRLDAARIQPALHILLPVADFR